MSTRTLRVTHPLMHGHDVTGCKHDLNERLAIWHVPYKLPVDGGWSDRDRDAAKSVLYGMGVDAGGDFDGVGPEDRTKIRHGWDALDATERRRNHDRAAWRKRLAERYAGADLSGVAKGIDVSNNNGHVDWAKVKTAGYKFAWAKASEGLTFNDAFLLENVHGARAHGIEIGAYHFLTTSGSPEAQAGHFAGRLRVAGLKKGDLRPVMDVEAAGVTVADAQRFAEELHHELSVYPANYTFPSFAASWPRAIVDNCPLWIANFDVAKPTIPPLYTKDAVWQFSSHAHVPGVASLCDVDTTKHVEELIWR